MTLVDSPTWSEMRRRRHEALVESWRLRVEVWQPNLPHAAVEMFAEAYASRDPSIVDASEWRPRALCRGVTKWFEAPDETKPIGKHAVARVERARELCRSCPVMPECLSWALTPLPDGTDPAYGLIAAATTPADRAPILRVAREHERAAKAAAEAAAEAARACAVCGYSLTGAHARREFCCDAHDPYTTRTGRRRWDEPEQLEGVG